MRFIIKVLMIPFKNKMITVNAVVPLRLKSDAVIFALAKKMCTIYVCLTTKFQCIVCAWRLIV
jgi:hypothetical protein